MKGTLAKSVDPDQDIYYLHLTKKCLQKYGNNKNWQDTPYIRNGRVQRLTPLEQIPSF